MPHSKMRKAGSLLLTLSLIGITVFSAFISRQSAYAASTATIDGSTKYQTMDGFGFSEAFGRAASMSSASATNKQQMLDLLFNTSTGAGLTIVRNIINSDSTSIEPNAPASPTATPAYVWDGSDSGQVWLSQQAQNYGVNQIYADAWSAPGYMKTNDSEANGGTLCGVPSATCSSGDWRQAYANYLAQYIKDYQSAGVTLSNVGFVNESTLSTSYSSMLINPAQATNFIDVLGPTLKSAGLSTKIVCCDSEGWNLAQSYISAIASDATANSYVSVLSSHGYTAAPTFAFTNTNGKHVWQSEWGNSDAWDPAWDDGTAGAGFTWAQSIYTGITAANLSAFFHWWGVNTSNSNNGLVYLNGSTVTASKRLWAFANYSRFIRPGAIRIAATTTASGLDLTAFLNTNGSISIVALNTASSATPLTFSLQNTGVANGASVVPYLTDTNDSTAAQTPLTVAGGAFSATVPARALVTYQISGSGSSGGVTPTPTTPTTPTATAIPSPTAALSPTATTIAGAVHVAYQVANQWTGGFTTNIIITNNSSTAISGWKLQFTFPGTQQITSLWNGQFTQTGSQVTINNLSYNGTIPANGGSVSLGFNGSWSGSNPVPTSFTLNGTSTS